LCPGSAPMLVRVGSCSGMGQASAGDREGATNQVLRAHPRHRQSRGGQRANAPMRARRCGLPELGGFGLAAPASQLEADHAGAFRGELQSPRSCHGEMGNFPDDRPQLWVAQSFFETREDRLLVSRFHIDHPVRREPGLGQCWCEEVLTADAPQHSTAGPRRDPGGEECSGSAVDRAIPAASHFVERPERQATSRQPLINGLDAEREYLSPVSRHTLKALNAVTKRIDGGNVDRRFHGLLLPVSQAKCSLFVLIAATVNGHAFGSGRRSFCQ